MKKIVAYRLVPVHEVVEGGISTAAIISCMATGRVLSGMGGGGLHLAPDVVEALKMEKGARVVCDASLHDSLVEMARMASEGKDVSKTAVSLLQRLTDA